MTVQATSNDNLLNYAFIYQPLTLGEVINALGTVHPDMTVPGMGPDILSYRGYYERPSVVAEPTSKGEWRTAGSLYEEYSMQLGDLRRGWKGGDYPVDASQPLYITEQWGRTGFPIIGFMPLGSVLRPILLDDSRGIL